MLSAPRGRRPQRCRSVGARSIPGRPGRREIRKSEAYLDDLRQKALTPREGRKFGVTVGGAFVLLAGISRWRGHDLAPWIMGGAGFALLAAAALIPGRLSPVHRAWMRLGLLLSKVTTPIFMSLVYFVVLTPTGMLIRLLGRNPLKARETAGTFWVTRSPEKNPAESLTRQF